MHVFFRWLALASLVFSLCACSSSSGTSGTPGGDAFYLPPDPLPSEVPGTLIRAEEIEPFSEGSKAWRVLYVSTAVDGTAIAVSGMVAAPAGPAPEAGYDVVTWSHGTKGVSDPCTPSKGYRSGFHDFYDIAPELVAAGYVGVSTDFEGLGTPGIHPYLVGASEGRGALDIIKAAQQVEGAGAGSRVVIWGRSQGGHSALFAGEIASTWAPELQVLGVISAAPASEFQAIIGSGAFLPGARGFIWQLTIGFEAAYAELSIEDLYTPEALAAIDALLGEEACGAEVGEVAKDFLNAGFTTSPVDLPDWSLRLDENSPGNVITGVPILLIQGEADTVVPILLTNVLAKRLCAIGDEIDYQVFPGFGHNDSTQQNMTLMLDWTAARFAGEPAATSCEE
ncbi:MAG: lipase family protein [Myxococcales bacterium]|nr:lipase family protein [Myxococcales bacterium]